MGLINKILGKKKDLAATASPEEKNVAVEKKIEKKEETGKLLKKVEKNKKDKKEELLKSTKKDTKNAYKVLIKPILTEKATATGAYLFMVSGDTNKQEIKKAIENVYGVKPKRVNVMNFKGRNVRWGRSNGKTKSWKKAMIYLKDGDKIDIYEGV